MPRYNAFLRMNVLTTFSLEELISKCEWGFCNDFDDLCQPLKTAERVFNIQTKTVMADFIEHDPEQKMPFVSVTRAVEFTTDLDPGFLKEKLTFYFGQAQPTASFYGEGQTIEQVEVVDFKLEEIFPESNLVEVIPEFCSDCYDNGEKETADFFERTTQKWLCEVCAEDGQNLIPLIRRGGLVFVQRTFAKRVLAKAK